MTRVFCGLTQCRHNDDCWCTAEEITLFDGHTCDGGCDEGWDMEDEEEDEE